MALTNIPQDVKENDSDSEGENGSQRSESPKVPMRGRGAWKPTPKPLLPSEVMRLKLEAPKEIEIVRFGVPDFGRRGGSEEDDGDGDGDGDEGSEYGFCLGMPEAAVGIPVKKELSDELIKTKAQEEVLLTEDYIHKLDEIRDLLHLNGAQVLEEREEPKKVQIPNTQESPAEPKAEVRVRKVKEKPIKKPSTKPEQLELRECKPPKIYESPTKRKPFQMKKQSELPARIETPTIRVRGLSEGPRSPTIASKLKWVNQPPIPTTPKKKLQNTPRSTQSCSKPAITPSIRKSTGTSALVLQVSGEAGRQVPTGSLLSSSLESSFRRPSPVRGVKHGANSPLPQGPRFTRRISDPLIPVVPREHILRLANLVECHPEEALEDVFGPLAAKVSPKPEIWNNRMRKEELCPGCRRCAVKFEFVCGDMVCGGCYDRLLKGSGTRGVRCIACQAVVG